MRKRRHSLELIDEERETMKAAVKRKCLDCCGAYYDAIRDRYHGPAECECYSCPLYPYAFGTNKWLRQKKWAENLEEWEHRQHQLWG